MPKVNTQRAGKDYPAEGIKKGDTYYSWAFFRGPTLRSKTYPKPSQLCGSEKKAAALRAYEDLQDAIAAATTPEDVKSALETASSDAQDAIDQYDEAISNLEDAFPGGCPGLDEANEQRDALESFQSDCDSAADDIENLDVNDYEVKPEAKSPEDGGRSWDDLTEEGQSEMLEAAREIAYGPSLEI